jgi:hypothetical protein
MICPNCLKNISDKVVGRYWGAKGGSKSKRVITPEQQVKMQEGRNDAKQRRS